MCPAGPLEFVTIEAVTKKKEDLFIASDRICVGSSDGRSLNHPTDKLLVRRISPLFLGKIIEPPPPTLDPRKLGWSGQRRDCHHQ